MKSKLLFVLMSSFAIAGCSQSISDMTCDDVESVAVSISEGELIKIMNGKETRRSERELVCHGTGVYSSNDNVRTRYKTFIDSDGDQMFSYDVDEEIERQTKAAVAEWEREVEAAQREIDREVARAERELRDILQGY